MGTEFSAVTLLFLVARLFLWRSGWAAVTRFCPVSPQCVLECSLSSGFRIPAARRVFLSLATRAVSAILRYSHHDGSE